MTLDENGTPDWTYDPNEPRYCLCNQVSYGDMVACDNIDVSKDNNLSKVHSNHTHIVLLNDVLISANTNGFIMDALE